jgi:cell wall-associated NlpC family hydrolase
VAKSAAAVIGALVLLVALIGAAGAGAASFLGLGSADGQTPVCSTNAAGVGTDLGDGEKLNATQVANAHTIYTTGVSLDTPPYGEAIALATAIQESRLINLTVATNDDSLGLFQQRPSQGWGTPAQITDPVYASTKFYQALQAVPNWQNLPLDVAAETVQKSAYPNAYAPWQAVAEKLVATFAGTVGACDLGAAGAHAAGLPANYALPPGTPQPVLTAIDYVLAQVGKPYLWGGTGPTGYDCSGLVMMAYAAAGVTLPRTTEQQVNAGTPVPNAANLEPGDLIFTIGGEAGASAANPGHVGMFIGDNLVVDAPSEGKNVEISEFNAGYWNTQAVSYRRVVPSESD